MAAREPAAEVMEALPESYEDDEDFIDEDMAPSPQRVVQVAPGTRQPPGRTYTRDDVRRIERDNVHLLHRLDQIQRKGPTINPVSEQPRHMAAAAINRRRKQNETHQENVAFLKRLEKVKSTVPSSSSASSRSRAKPGPPRRKAPPAKKMVQPEWQN
ncbi:uncharacterized protein MONBRDRAFT_7037 [Monosiga brevicollis MX1]|uniref:Cilia- and flagella-associated protein 97 n=1 Tax=Monosiga brevicollis TaxID=81824 RepID=A9UVQ3_MONBE|nr:uncharacterized protein MONBRDRAFT_7037 [Monosiga brevicollis MX1]EDQ90434.1 predicted protein [Monosiga brevicollis MX1]|eukprot:XP_001744485.1 hypothetical protein [Monosiga brevicollis MX1]